MIRQLQQLEQIMIVFILQNQLYCIAHYYSLNYCVIKTVSISNFIETAV